MYCIGSYAVPQILSVNPDMQIDSFVFPANDNADKQVLNSGVDLQFSVMKDCKNKEAAYEVLRFMLEDENIQIYLDEQNAVPCKEGDFELPSMLDGVKEYIENDKMTDYQDHHYPSEMAVDAMIHQTMTDFLTAYPQFCSAANDFVLSYSQECFNWDKSILTVCAKPLSLTKNAEIVMSYQSGSSETGRLYLVQKPQKIDIPIGVYVNTEIDANRAVSLDFQWLQSDTFITTITECTGISDGEYYLAWVGRSNNSHPKIRFLKVLKG